MLDVLLLQLINNVVVPEVLGFVKRKKDETGTWPSVEEVQTEVTRLHDQIKSEGLNFLNRK